MELFEGQSRNLDEGPGLLESVWQYKWLIAVAALLGALLGYGWQARQPTLYEGSTRLWLSIGNSALPGDSTAPPQEPQRFLSNQAQVITSGAVVQRAAKGTTSPGSLWAAMTVEVAKDADVITIRVRDPNPERAARLAEAVGRAYNEFVIQQSSKAARDEIKRLRVVASDLNAQLQQISAALGADPNNLILEARQAAVRKALDANVTRSEDLADRARNGASPLQWQEPAAVPQGPVQPAPRRGAMAGFLLGLVGSAALAWWLSIRAARQPGAGWQPHDGRWGWPAKRAGWQEPATDNTLGSLPPTPQEQESVRERMDTAPAEGNGAHLGSVAAVMRSAAAVPNGYGEQDLRTLFAHLEATFGNKPLDWYLDNCPQLMADQVTLSVSTHMVAILLDNGEGSLVVAGSFGLTAEEEGATVPQSHDALRETLAEGLGIFQESTDRIPKAAAGIPGSKSAQALVMVPLVCGPSSLGVLVAGRHSANGHRVASFNDQEIERLIMYALEISPVLQTLLLLDQLRRSAQSLVVAYDDQAEPAAD